MNDNPLVIFGSPRGGTSLAAGVFTAHGFWTGKTYPGTQGYANHENAVMKEFIKKNFKMNAGVAEPDPGKANLFTLCSSVVPFHTNWMWKGPMEYFPIFNFWFPKMTPVFVFRKFEQAVEGAVRRQGEKVRESATQIIESRYKYLNDLLDQGIGYRVDADAIIRGDLDQIKPILQIYDIEMDHGLAMSTIDPSRFHM